MEKHFLVTSLESGLSLMSEVGHAEGVASLQTALKSSLLEGIDITSMGLPKGESPIAMMCDEGYWPDPRSWMAQFRPYSVKNGTLTIPVRGVLLHGVTLTYGRYFTGYEYVMRATTRAKLDPEVRNVIYLVDSNGGHVASCFDTCDAIADIGKPTIAFIADFANSAGYAIAASCDKVIGTQTVLCGNIGVLKTHIDSSKMYDNIGIKYEYVTAPEGGDKAEGHAGTKITDGMRTRGQNDVNEIYEIFVSAVTRKRKITAEKIRESKAHAFQKEASLEMGLIDMVASAVDMLKVASDVFGSESFGADDDRTATAPSGETEETRVAKDGKMTDEEMNAEIASKTKAAKVEGATEAKARIGDILGLDEAKGREALASHFAFKTDMDVESVKAALAAAPIATNADATKSTPAGGGSTDALKTSFDQQMSKVAPNLSANLGDDDKTNDADKSLNATKSLATRAGIGGYRSVSNQ